MGERAFGGGIGRPGYSPVLLLVWEENGGDLLMNSCVR